MGNHPIRSGIIAVASLALIIAANWWGAADDFGRVVAWIVTLLAMILVIAEIGLGLNGRWAGVLIDNRNRVSLSKLQAVSWTVLVLSGLVSIAALRLNGIDTNAGTLGISAPLLACMGISATSLVATPVILSIKAPPPPGDIPIFNRNSPAFARWADIFRGDDAANAGWPDLSKIQQFFISLLVLGYFAFSLGNVLRFGVLVDGRLVHQLPSLDEDLVWLLGISHAGYLAYKAAPHQPTGDAAPLVDPRQQAAG